MPKEYISITPTWEWAVAVHLEALKNPNAPALIHKNAEAEILRCARILDLLIASKESENADR